MKRSGQVDRLGGGGGVRWVDQRGWRDGSVEEPPEVNATCLHAEHTLNGQAFLVVP